MQQLDTLRKRFAVRSRWFQMGLASATLLTPLVKRWNDLRAAERTRALRDEAEMRLRNMRARMPMRRDETQTLREARVTPAPELVTAPWSNVSATIWLVGVGVGLVVAGAGAYFLVRRRLSRALEEPMVELHAAPNGNNVYTREAAQAMAREISRLDQREAGVRAMSGADVADGSAAFSSTVSPLMPPPSSEPEDASLTPPLDDALEEAVDEFSVEQEARAAGDLLAGEMEAETETPAFIGNIRTMVYHTADADNLPTEENRIYFASEEEARQMGYHRDRDEVSSGGE